MKKDDIEKLKTEPMFILEKDVQRPLEQERQRIADELEELLTHAVINDILMEELGNFIKKLRGSK